MRPDRPLRVLLVEANEDGTTGGSHQALFDLAVGMNRERYEPVALFYEDNIVGRRLCDAGVEVHSFAQERADEVRVHQSGRKLAKLLELGRAVQRRHAFLRAHRIDLVHLNNAPETGSDDWLPAARVHGAPVVAFAMGPCPFSSPVHRWLAARVDHTIAISQFMADGLPGRGVAPEKTSVVRLAVDIARFRSQVQRSRADVREELGVAPGQVLALMVGNVREWKGQHVVLEAVALLEPSVRAKLALRFAGAVRPIDAPYFERCQADIAAHDLTSSCRFLGSRTDIPELLSASDIAVHASVVPEPFGLVLTEALAAGLPVVATVGGGPSEVLTEECGRLFDPRQPAQLAAHLTALLTDGSLRARMSSAALARAPMFDVAHFVRGCEQVYARVRPPRTLAA